LNKDELIAHFNEHVLFELLMLRYSYMRLSAQVDQISWNALFAAFNVSARNLYEFVSNEGGRDAVGIAYYRLVQISAGRSIGDHGDASDDKRPMLSYGREARSDAGQESNA